MRKVGLGFTVFGGGLGILLFFLRRTAWYAAEAATNLSEAAEFIDSAFWASVITLIAGLLLLLFSLKKTNQEEEAPEEYGQEPAPAYESAYDTYSAETPAEIAAVFADTAEATYPGQTASPTPYDWSREPEDATRQVPADVAEESDWTCQICGCQNPGFSRVCAVCGSAYGSSL